MHSYVGPIWNQDQHNLQQFQPNILYHLQKMQKTICWANQKNFNEKVPGTFLQHKNSPQNKSRENWDPPRQNRPYWIPFLTAQPWCKWPTNKCIGIHHTHTYEQRSSSSKTQSGEKMDPPDAMSSTYGAEHIWLKPSSPNLGQDRIDKWQFHPSHMHQLW